MKRIILIFIIIILCLSGCADTADVPEIHGYTWEMKTVQSGSDGSVIACAPSESVSFPGAEEVVMTCEAENGFLTIRDLSSDKLYTGTYDVADKTLDSVIYDITIDGKTGYAVTAMTTYADGSGAPTFIISINDYALNFLPEK